MKRQSNHEKQPRYTREKKFVAILAAAGALGGAALAGCSTTGDKIYAADESGRVTATYDVDDVLDGKIAPITSAEKPNGSELTEEQRFNLNPKAYAELDEFIRAKDQAKYFSQYFESSYEKMIAPAAYTIYSDDEREMVDKGAFYMPDLKKPRSQWNDQDYLNYWSISIYFVTAQTNPKDALQSLSVLARPGSKTFSNFEAWIKENPGVGIVELYEATPTVLSDKELKPGSINGVVIDDKGGRLIGHKSLAADNKVGYSVFVNRSDAEGNTIAINEFTFNQINNSALDSLIDQNI